MIRLNIHQVKTHLSACLDRLAKGETIVLCKRNIPIAEIRPLPSRQAHRRPLGLDQGKFVVPPEFFEPLPEEILTGFADEKR